MHGTVRHEVAQHIVQTSLKQAITPRFKVRAAWAFLMLGLGHKRLERLYLCAMQDAATITLDPSEAY